MYYPVYTPLYSSMSKSITLTYNRCHMIRHLFQQPWLRLQLPRWSAFNPLRSNINTPGGQTSSPCGQTSYSNGEKALLSGSCTHKSFYVKLITGISALLFQNCLNFQAKHFPYWTIFNYLFSSEVFLLPVSPSQRLARLCGHRTKLFPISNVADVGNH